MSDSTPAAPPPGEPSPAGQDRQAERYEVTVEAASPESADELTVRVSAMDLDRLPDREGVRLLVDAEALDRLRAQGLQVQVHRSVPVQPLDPSLIAADQDVADWLSERLASPGSATDEER
jgi:hypothetical protein